MSRNIYDLQLNLTIEQLLERAGAYVLDFHPTGSTLEQARQIMEESARYKQRAFHRFPADG